MDKDILIGSFNSEENLIDSMKQLKSKAITIKEVYIPYPIHEVLKLMGNKTRISYASFFIGVGALLLILGGMYFAAVVDWPLNFGGKPSEAFPSFIVVSIVATILAITLGTLFVFSIRTKLYPGKEIDFPNLGATDDKFIIVVSCNDKLGNEIENIILTNQGEIINYRS